MMICKSSITASSRRSASVVVRAQAQAGDAVPRRAALVAVAGAALAIAAAPAARARDFQEALAAKEARRAKLRDAAAERKATGKDAQAFKDSEYQVGEESTTPQGHSRQNEGAKTQVNV